MYINPREKSVDYRLITSKIHLLHPLHRFQLIKLIQHLTQLNDNLLNRFRTYDSVCVYW
jgi:hypothetical protein